MESFEIQFSSREWVARGHFAKGAAIVLLSFCSLAVTSSGAQGSDSRPAGLRGAVTDPGATPVREATIVALSTGNQALTDSLGQFTLSGLPAGENAFFVKRLGFQSHAFSLVLPPDSILSIAVRLWPIASTLPDVVTMAKISSRLYTVGFADRKARVNGVFITRADIEARPSTRVSDFLRGVPRVYLQSFGPRGVIPYAGAHCKMQLLIDGLLVNLDPRLVTLLTLDDVVNPEIIEGIEVYPSATDAPIQFQSISKACGTLVIWTRK